MWPGASQWGERVSVLFSPSNINISIFFLVLSLCFFSFLGEGRNGNEVPAFSRYGVLSPPFFTRVFMDLQNDRISAFEKHPWWHKTSLVSCWRCVSWTLKRNVNLDIPVGISYPLNVLSALILAIIVSDCHRESFELLFKVGVMNHRYKQKNCFL